MGRFLGAARRLASAIAGLLGGPRRPIADRPEAEAEAVGPRDDEESRRRVDELRRRYRDGPVGLWRSALDHRLGWGFDGTGLLGNTIEFRPDGTGTLDPWGYQGKGDPETFRWVATGTCGVNIKADGRPGEPPGDDDDEEELVRYDFYLEFGCRDAFLYQSNSAPGEGRFWWGVGPLVEVEPPRGG